MATYQQLQQYAQNPNVRKMLDLIASAEGVRHGYNTGFGNTRFESLQAHPNIRKSFTQTDGRKNYTTAAGRYQFLNKTWQSLAKRYGLKDFSGANQDLGAIALLVENGALSHVLNGDFKVATQKSGRTWASLPSSPYAQGKRSWDFVNKSLGGGGSQQQPQRIPVQKWSDLTANSDRIPVQRWSDLINQDNERIPVQKWSDLTGGANNGN
ncbi:lysozyme [Acinetobacter sp. WCHAc010034]|uniref:glycoside hydrolase family 24 protein n=1 Tax=Acinetobacter sp. WCHAc010034 TaxID=1879049 RepID=UPI00083B44E3|nr:glycoside hydrolase family 104 protein [Acinetobacter sp. WCHAc010034]AYA04630.1 lysozyme [Acinetobacter sp. WCHAc010034]